MSKGVKKCIMIVIKIDIEIKEIFFNLIKY